MEEESKERPLKVSVNMAEKTISVAKGYSEVILTEDDCRIIEILYDEILKEKENK